MPVVQILRRLLAAPILDTPEQTQRAHTLFRVLRAPAVIRFDELSALLTELSRRDRAVG
jgi:hypothetical protein